MTWWKKMEKDELEKIMAHFETKGKRYGKRQAFRARSMRKMFSLLQGGSTEDECAVEIDVSLSTIRSWSNQMERQQEKVQQEATEKRKRLKKVERQNPSSMSELLGFSVRIFVPAGDPEGLRVIEKSNWTGQGIVFPRSLFAEVRHREELNRTGVYVLWEPGGGSGQLPRVYMGEGDVLLPRLDSHAKNKDFWTHGVAFTSKDQSLNKAHVQHLEARLVQLATEAKRCELDNTNVPQMPSLSDADKADAELYLADMLLCLPVVGVSFFEKPRGPADKSRELFLSSKEIQARGYEGPGGFVVRSGSQAVKNEVASIHTYLSDLRKTLLSQGIFEDTGTAYQLAQDYIFASPSTAAGVLLGRVSNGRTEWKDAERRSLKEIQGVEGETP